MLLSSIVRILDVRGRVVGAGFAVSQKHVVTCTFIVAAGWEVSEDLQTPLASPVLLETALESGKTLTARVTHWQPANEEVFAILELEQPLDHLQPAHLMAADEFWGHHFRAFGFPHGYNDGVWIRGELQGMLQSSGWVQFDTSGSTVFSKGARGFGGTAVWDEQLAGVVGMIVAAEASGNTGFLLPISKIAAAWPEFSKNVAKEFFEPLNKPQTSGTQPRAGGSGKLGSPESIEIHAQIANTAFVGSEQSGSTGLDIDPYGSVVVIGPGASRVVTKLPQEAAYERIATAADAVRRQIEKIYEQGRSQSEQWSRFSLIAAIFGFLVVLGGVAAMLIGNTPVGLITSAAGVIPEVAAALFFQQAKEANKRVDEIREKLLEAEGIHRAIELSLTTDEATQNRLKEAIISQILGLPPKDKQR